MGRHLAVVDTPAYHPKRVLDFLSAAKVGDELVYYRSRWPDSLFGDRDGSKAIDDVAELAWLVAVKARCGRLYQRRRWGADGRKLGMDYCLKVTRQLAMPAWLELCRTYKYLGSTQ